MMSKKQRKLPMAATQKISRLKDGDRLSLIEYIQDLKDATRKIRRNNKGNPSTWSTAMLDYWEYVMGICQAALELDYDSCLGDKTNG